MWQTSKPCYSEKDMLKMLKSASMDKLMEYLLLKTRRASYEQS